MTPNLRPGQLRDLRRAAASTTKVLKAPTTFVELKKEESCVKLPPIVLPKPSCDHSKYELEIQRLTDSIEDIKELHLIQIEQLKGQLYGNFDITSLHADPPPRAVCGMLCVVPVRIGCRVVLGIPMVLYLQFTFLDLGFGSSGTRRSRRRWSTRPT